MTNFSSYDAVTLTLNPAIDQTLSIDNFTAGAVNRVKTERQVAGGKGVNVASALADFGLQVGASGFLGRDNDAIFTQLFAAKNIADLCVRLDGATRIGIKIADAAQGETTDINFPGLSPSPRVLAQLQEELVQTRAAWFVLAGSLPPDVEADFYIELTKKLRAKGARIAFDSSGDALKSVVEAPREALPHFIKPNISELETLLETPLSSRAQVLEAARELVKRGIETVAVSMGADGALFVQQGAAIFAKPPHAKVESTVGAGDAMVAGTVAAQLQNLSLEETARLATAFSLEALASLQAGISSLQNVRVLAAQVEIESVL